MISFAMGNRRRVKFWKDKWCSKEPLCETFITLFALSNSKEVKKKIGTFDFFRNLNDWALGVMERFLSKL